MFRNIKNRRTIYWHLGVWLLSLFVISIAAEQITATEVRFVKVGRYWVAVTDDGSQAEVSLDSGWFPADFNVVGSETSSGSGSSGGNLELMVADFPDPETGENIPKVINTSVSALNPDGTIIDPITSFVRYDYSTVSVNDQELLGQPIGEVDPSQLIGTADQVVESTYEYAIGVQANRKVYAWSQQNHDNYIVIDVTFTNVGDQTLNDFLVCIMQSHNDYVQANGNNPSPSGISNDSYRWRHYYGGSPGDSQRVFYSYHADDAQQSGDNMGNPVYGQEGRLVDPDAHFYGFLHVSEAPYTDPSADVDDPEQPITTFIAKGDFLGIGDNNRELLPLEASGVWWDAMRGSISDQTPLPGQYADGHHEINNDQFGNPDYQAFSNNVDESPFNAGRYSGIGPYATFAPGESIRIIYVSGYASLSLPLAKEVGKKMLNGTLETPPNIPDPDKGFFPSNFAFPSGANEMDIMKDLWYSTVIDSVHKTIYRARWNYEHNWMVPQAPPPPTNFSVKGFADNATITWSAPEAEALANFAGYRVLRRKSNLDTAFFEIIHETAPDDKAETHTYEDTEVQFGASYYYYVQSMAEVDAADANALPNIRGEKITSGRVFVPSPESIEPPRGGTETLSDIIIAPNPYNINDPAVQAQGWVDFRGIVFFNLPSYCEVDIYTEDGSLVKEILHDSPVRAGSLRWDMLTDSQQVISSGIYIAVFTDKDGGIAYRKFGVTR